jgi:hypothetical protein
MIFIGDIPPERDIPADRRADLRAGLLTMIAQPAPAPAPVPAPEPRPDPRRGGGRRLAHLAAAGLVLIAGAAIALAADTGSGSDDGSEVYALGDGVLSQRAREAGRQCLQSIRDADRDDPLGERWPTWPANATPTLLNYTEQPGQSAFAIYRTGSQLIYCEVFPGTTFGRGADGPWVTGSMGFLDASPWLPGPIHRDVSVSSDRDGGHVKAAGRVSKRVAQVTLDDGAGHRSTARVAHGTFIVFSDGRLAAGKAELISYDAAGTEIDRQPALDRPTGRCYVDPAGNLVDPGGVKPDTAHRDRCQPAEQW